MDWDKYFVSLMYMVAMKSKDEKTQNGTVIVGKDNEIISTGYNSFPRGLNDDLQERQERPEKYYWFEHGERNAIYNAARIGVSLLGCKMYITGIPCMDCARGIVQSGISDVIYHNILKYDSNLWDEHHKRTLILFNECNVKIRKYEGDVINKISVRRDGKLITI